MNQPTQKTNDSTEEEEEELEEEPAQTNFKQLYKDQEKFMDKIYSLNDNASIQIKTQKYKQAIRDLQLAEQMLEFGASCGRNVDRNLIIVILYNQACAYQCQWVLDKCAKYLDGVIYNLELVIKEDQNDTESLVSTQEKESLLVRRYTFLARSYLQYCAILSQLGKHKQALANAKKAASIMRELFKISYEFCKEWSKKNDSQGSATTAQSNHSSKHNKREMMEPGKKKFYMKDEVEFAKLVIEQSRDILHDMAQLQDLDTVASNEKLILKEAKRQLYFWRNNPENNEKHIRRELGADGKQEEYRSLLGVQNIHEWIENFNIGSIMHMTPQTYEEFTQYGELIYEISKRVLLEKVIYMSISYFTIATELRFVEIDKAKLAGKSDKDIDTNEFKMSELYHLKAIEIACKNITCSSPYINHLITSYHKHYNSNLDTIQEESITSIVSEANYKESKMQKFKQLQIQTAKDNNKSIEQHKSLEKVIPKVKLDQKLAESKSKDYKSNEMANKPKMVGFYDNKFGDSKLYESSKYYETKHYDRQFDQSPTGKLINSFLNQPSPLKSNRNATSDNIRPSTNLIEQMIQNKKKSQHMPTEQQQQSKFHNSSVNNSVERITELSSILRKQTFNEILSNTMTIQLQPYKSTKNLNNMIKQMPFNQPTSTFFDTCRTERNANNLSNADRPTFSPISTRNNVNKGSPEKPINDKYVYTKQKPTANSKTPQNRLRTQTQQQQQQQSNLPLKLETIQQLLKGKLMDKRKQ